MGLSSVSPQVGKWMQIERLSWLYSQRISVGISNHDSLTKCPVLQMTVFHAAGSYIDLRNRLNNMALEHDQAKSRVQEWLAEGLQLEARYKELHHQTATSTDELEAKMRVTQMEVERQSKAMRTRVEVCQAARD